MAMKKLLFIIILLCIAGCVEPEYYTKPCNQVTHKRVKIYKPQTRLCYWNIKPVNHSLIYLQK